MGDRLASRMTYMDKHYKQWERAVCCHDGKRCEMDAALVMM